MSVKFELYMTDSILDKVFALKDEAGRNELTANEYAEILLERYVNQLHPQRVQFDEETGERIPRKK